MNPSPDPMARARDLLAARVSFQTLLHSERVARTARELAERFGVDADAAELAGLLHDYAREDDDAALLSHARSCGIEILPLEEERPMLLHARIGGQLVRRDLPEVSDEVVAAISAHTTGSAEMSDLDKVVYLADMIEPGRAFEGVEELRTACETEPLSECFRLGYGSSLRHVREKGARPHPVSEAVAAAIAAETGLAVPDGAIRTRGGLFGWLRRRRPPSSAEEGVAALPVAEIAEPEPVVELGSEPEPGSAPSVAIPEADEPAPCDGPAGPPPEEEGTEGPAIPSRRHWRARAKGRLVHARHKARIEADADHDGPGAATALLSGLALWARRAVTLVVISAVVMATVFGLVLGINSLARWNSKRMAGRTGAPPVAKPLDNLLVIGVKDGSAVGFAALKAERGNKRVLGIAIPDGAFVEVPGQGFERLGASYLAGPEISKAAVSNYLAVPFKRFVIVDDQAYLALLQSQDIASLMSQVQATDLKASERRSFESYFSSVDESDVWIVPLPVKPVAVGDQRYFEPQREQVADLLLQWWGVRLERQRSAPRVIVYNGVGTPGIAGEAAQQLIREGFRVVDSGNAQNFEYSKTQILLYHGTQDDAEAVREALGTGEVRVQSAPQELTDMIVIIGADYRPPVDDATVPTEGVQ